MKTPVWSARLNGQAVKYSTTEAWWIIDGQWHKADLPDVFNNASMMTDAQFEQMFPNLPALPDAAFKPIK